MVNEEKYPLQRLLLLAGEAPDFTSLREEIKMDEDQVEALRADLLGRCGAMALEEHDELFSS